MFQSAVNRLTAWYVGVLVVVCMMFSVPAYGLGATRLRQGAERQFEIIQHSPYPSDVPFEEIEQKRAELLRKDQSALLREIIEVDAVIIAAGSILGYLFAKQTLQPIEESHIRQVRFTADASHELRTPLSVLQTEIEVALRDKKLNLTEAKQVLASNLEEVSRLRNLSDQLLSLTKIGGGITMSRVSLSSLLKREVSDLSKRYKIAISKDIASGVSLRGNQELIGELVAILVDNGVKYAGASKPKITVSLLKSDKKAVIKVKDLGVGIPPEDLGHIFERFHRGKTSSPIKGHGLGLAIAKDIVEVHGGKIEAKSQPGETVFSASFPQ